MDHSFWPRRGSTGDRQSAPLNAIPPDRDERQVPSILSLAISRPLEIDQMSKTTGLTLYLPVDRLILMTINETRTAVLDVAQEFLQTRGYNAFSFRDLADRVRIKSASIHYYFPTKRELCLALVARQREQVASALSAIDEAGLDAGEKLHRYAGIFQDTLALENRMCLCGMLASDHATLDPEIVRNLRLAFDDHEVWLTRVLEEGRADGSSHFDGTASEEARSLLSSLEGAMLLARAYEDPARFEMTARRLLAKLRAIPNG